MNHLEQFKVAFIGATTRQVVESGVIKKYYRNAFKLNGKIYSVANGEDLSGKAGYVQFVKAGEDNANGGKVAKDAFSLLFACSAGTNASAQEAIAGLE